jgi:hypothetical protein
MDRRYPLADYEFINWIRGSNNTSDDDGNEILYSLVVIDVFLDQLKYYIDAAMTLWNIS